MMSREFVKVFVYVPTRPMTRQIDGKHFESPADSILRVIDKLKDIGVAVVGNYDNVSFTHPAGQARYRAIPGSAANPSAGRIGELHSENETVIAFTASKNSLDVLLKALKENHPYETPVIDFFDLVRHDFDALPER